MRPGRLPADDPREQEARRKLTQPERPEPEPEPEAPVAGTYRGRKLRKKR